MSKWGAWLLAACLCVLSFSTAAADADEKRFQACRKKLQQANKLDVLHDLDWKLPKEPKVVVGPTFFQMDFTAKEGFLSTLNCFLSAGKLGLCVNFDVLHWQTGKAIGRHEFCKFQMT